MNNVQNIVTQGKGHLVMSGYVVASKEDPITGHRCGTACCMLGWLPATFPDKYWWTVRNKRENTILESSVKTDTGRIVFPGVTVELSCYLEGLSPELYRSGFPRLSLASDMEEVTVAWRFVIHHIREGKFDRYILWK